MSYSEMSNFLVLLKMYGILFTKKKLEKIENYDFEQV